ncbi:MAG: c-type cytochrome biogenesis protein CcmI [Proteobacteria bacterium]|nr:c-type cytochrome biogenesis protein CcmI [Pseudomonadota bacterium]MDA1022293.1 c-type cytochrome biogenesis protein CcmI [Pseudomonadota bacterium]
MTMLWVSAGLMTCVVLAALLFPLLRTRQKDAPARADYDIAVFKDQLSELDRDIERGLLDDNEAEAARVEIQRRMLAAAGMEDAGAETSPGQSRLLAVGISLALPVAAFGLYLYLGAPDAPNQAFAKRAISQEITQRQGKLDKGEVLQMAAKLEESLKKDPTNLQAWTLLARTYLTISEFDRALAAYEQAMEVGNRHPDIVSSYAEALVMQAQGQITVKARGLFEGIFKNDALNPRARYYLGLSLAQEGKVKEALQAWVDLRTVSPSGAPWLDAVDTQIERAAKDLGVAPWSIKPTAGALALAKTLPPPPPSSLPSSTPSAPSSAPSSAPGPSRADMEAAQEMAATDRSKMIRTMVKRLADRLADEPDDLEGWKRLARAYEVLGETEKAKQAKARIESLTKK